MTPADIQSPITVAVLDAAYAQNESIYKDRLVQFPSGTYDEQRNSARDMMEKLLIAKDWLVRSGQESAQYIGPFGRIDVQKGQRVVIKAGSMIFSTRTDPSISARKRVVTVHAVDEGYIDRHRGQPEVRQPVVNWAGAGGYWCRTDLANVEGVAGDGQSPQKPESKAGQEVQA